MNTANIYVNIFENSDLKKTLLADLGSNKPEFTT